MQRHWIIMRHAEAEHNVLSIYNSNPEHPNYQPVSLTEHGRSQVRASASLLRSQGIAPGDIGHVRVSPLPRTQETAAILHEEGMLQAAPIETEQRLIEVCMGDREGTRYGSQDHSFDLSDAQAYRGESVQQLRKRLVHLVDEIRASHREGHILLVTHGSPALQLIQYLDGDTRHLSPAAFQLIPFVED